METGNAWPWWWWINPWLYIKRRAAAYESTIESLRCLAISVKYPEAPSPYDPWAGPEFVEAVTARCQDCGLWYIKHFKAAEAARGAEG